MIRIETFPKRTELLCAFVHEGSKKALGLPDGANASVAQSVRDNGGRLANLTMAAGSGSAKRILLGGIGKRKEMANDTLRHVAGKMALKARELELGRFSVICPPGSAAEQALAASQIVEGARMALYKFERFKAEKAGTVPELTLVCPKSAGIARAVRESETIAEGAVFVKEIANMPPNECSPSTLAGYARRISGAKMRCRIISKGELKRRGFGGITAVGQGSRNEPKLIILEYSGGPKSKRPVVLVGKAVTFDTGGISLKPGEKMDEMKFDKCGGCTVLGIMRTVSRLGLAVNVVGIVPSVENMPGGESYRPGDIIRLYNKKTAEILNTDAEGRLILADALAYGEKHYRPQAIIDFATLTGACIVALGNNVAGMVSSDKKLAERISESSRRTAEQVWELPLNRDYMDMIKSDIADMRNMGIGRAAGTITASAFLKNAVEKTPWAHIDIAGVAWTQPATKERSYNPKGATGFGLRLAVDYLRNLH